MLFTAAGLQQATGELVKAPSGGTLRRAGRVADPPAASAGIAGPGRDRPRLPWPPTATRPAAAGRTICRLRARGGRISPIRLAPAPLVGGHDAAFLWIRAAYRRGRRRISSPADYEPPLGSILERYAAAESGAQGGAGYRLWGSPELTPTTRGRSRRWRSSPLQGEVKEAVLWTRGLAMVGALRRRAGSCCRAALTLTDADAPDACPVGRRRRYLYEPDGAAQSGRNWSPAGGHAWAWADSTRRSPN